MFFLCFFIMFFDVFFVPGCVADSWLFNVFFVFLVLFTHFFMFFLVQVALQTAGGGFQLFCREAGASPETVPSRSTQNALRRTSRKGMGTLFAHFISSMAASLQPRFSQKGYVSSLLLVTACPVTGRLLPQWHTLFSISGANSW